ncbi:MAG: LysE family translocator [Pseudomonadota bacterium]
MAYDLAHWITFFSAAVLLNLSPGPDFAFILGHTVKGGPRQGFAAMLGIWAGALFHVLLAVLGVSAIVATSAIAFSVVKWAGIAYLVWLGIQTLRQAGGSFAVDRTAPPVGLWPIFQQGVLIDLLNPKVAVFFLAFLPQFVQPEAGPVPLQLLLHGMLIIVVAALVEIPLVFLGGKLTTWLRESKKAKKRLDQALGALLIALAAKLMLVER